MNLKSSSTVKQAREEVGRALSQPDREEQIRMLNLIRQWVYANQRQLGLDISTLVCASCEEFCNPCKERCKDSYRGIRLPLAYQSVEAVRYMDQHVPVFSPFRIPYDGVSGFPCDGKMKLFDNGWSPLERDFKNCCPSQVRFWGEKLKCCPIMNLTGIIAGEDREETIDYHVTTEPQVTDKVFSRITAVSFSEPLKGRVILAEPCGRELARYNTGEIAPQFREFKIVDDGCGCPCNQLVIIANCQYRDLQDDDELVEFGNPLVWQTLARYISLLNKPDKSTDDRANLRIYLETAIGLMVEQAAVENNENLSARLRRKPIRGSRLSSSIYGARRR